MLPSAEGIKSTISLSAKSQTTFVSSFVFSVDFSCCSDDEPLGEGEELPFVEGDIEFVCEVNGFFWFGEEWLRLVSIDGIFLKNNVINSIGEGSQLLVSRCC